MKVITIFGSGQVTEKDPDYKQAVELGQMLAKAGYIVCNGGYGGIMEASARGAKEGGGKTIGITTEDFGGPANKWIDQEIRVKKWSERLFKLIETGDAFVIFDGGTGTLVELFVSWEMSNKGFIKKSIVVIGEKLCDLITSIRKLPHVTDNPHIYFATNPAEAVKILREHVDA